MKALDPTVSEQHSEYEVFTVWGSVSPVSSMALFLTALMWQCTETVPDVQKGNSVPEGVGAWPSGQAWAWGQAGPPNPALYGLRELDQVLKEKQSPNRVILLGGKTDMSSWKEHKVQRKSRPNSAREGVPCGDNKGFAGRCHTH